MHLSEIQQEAWETAEEKGFHEGRDNLTPIALALIHSEVTEALEADRRGQDNFGEELADIIIRVADLAGCEDIDLEQEVKDKMAENRERPEMHGGKDY